MINNKSMNLKKKIKKLKTTKNIATEATKIDHQTNFFIKINGFYRSIKPKAHFKDQTSKTEEDIFQKPTE